MRLISPRAIVATVLLLAGSGRAFAQNSNLSDHDRQIHNESERNTRYFNNADAYPKPSTENFRRFFPPEPVRRQNSNDGGQQRANNAPTQHQQTREEFFEKVKQLSAAGDVDAKIDLANCYYYGLGVALDKAEAFRLYREAGAARPHMEAIAGAMLYAGEGVAANPAEGLAMEQHAAAAGDKDAIEWLAEVHPTPEQVEQSAMKNNYRPMLYYAGDLLSGENGRAMDTAKAIMYLQRGAAAGDRDSARWLAVVVPSPEAIEELKRKSAAGDVEAKTDLASCYNEARGVALNKAEAYRLYREAGATLPWAMGRAGGMLYSGDGVIANEAEGLAMVQQAAAQGHDSSIKWLAAVHPTPEQVEQSATMNNYSPMLFYAVDLLYGKHGREHDVAKGTKYLQRGAAAGHKHSIEWLEKLFPTLESIEAIEASAAKNDYQPMLKYANDLLHGTNGREQDPAKAFTCFQKLAAAGIGEAQEALAIAYWSDNNNEKAVAWAQKAADNGESKSMYMLALVYRKGGAGLPKDPGKSLEWMLKAADKGDEQAMNKLASYYRDGDGVSQDAAKSAEWMQKAAELGDANAMQELGGYYQKGFGVPQNPFKAIALLQMAKTQSAADQGEADAMYELANIYNDGLILPKNTEKFSAWLQKAADHGYEQAKTEIAEGRTLPAKLAKAKAAETTPPAPIVLVRADSPEEAFCRQLVALVRMIPTNFSDHRGAVEIDNQTVTLYIATPSCPELRATAQYVRIPKNGEAACYRADYTGDKAIADMETAFLGLAAIFSRQGNNQYGGFTADTVMQKHPSGVLAASVFYHGIAVAVLNIPEKRDEATLYIGLVLSEKLAADKAILATISAQPVVTPAESTKGEGNVLSAERAKDKAVGTTPPATVVEARTDSGAESFCKQVVALVRMAPTDYPDHRGAVTTNDADRIFYTATPSYPELHAAKQGINVPKNGEAAYYCATYKDEAALAYAQTTFLGFAALFSRPGNKEYEGFTADAVMRTESNGDQRAYLFYKDIIVAKLEIPAKRDSGFLYVGLFYSKNLVADRAVLAAIPAQPLPIGAVLHAQTANTQTKPGESKNVTINIPTVPTPVRAGSNAPTKVRINGITASNQTSYPNEQNSGHSGGSRTQLPPGHALGPEWAGKNLQVASASNLDLVWIAPGSFTMGDAKTGPAHAVHLTRGYWLGHTEVTQTQWMSLMETNPSPPECQGPDLPVGKISWDEAMEFCRRVTASERSASRLPDGYEYSLPTEAEWEYACRAGTTGTYAGDGTLETMGWYDGNSGDKPHDVSKKSVNVWGLSDMHGNVCEWCYDWDSKYPTTAQTDPVALDPDPACTPDSGPRRINRGGGWNSGASDCSSSYRYRNAPTVRNRRLGFRLALSPVR